MDAKSILEKSIMSMVVKVGETVEGKDIFKKIRIGFLDDKASDEAIFNLGVQIQKLFDGTVETIAKENAYSIERA